MSRHRQVDLLRSGFVGLRISFLILVSSEVSRRCAFIFLYSSRWMLVFLLRSSHGVATNVCDTQECCLYTITLTAQLERSDNIAKIPTSGFLIYWSEVNGSSRCWRKSAWYLHRTGPPAIRILCSCTYIKHSLSHGLAVSEGP